MKLKKWIALFLILVLAASLLVGCAKDNKDTKDPEETTAPAEEVVEGVYVTINGQNVQLGMAYADVADKLGEETQPAEVIDSCDPESDWKQTMHYYPGVTITEDKDGNLDSFSLGEPVNGSEVLFMGKIKVGATADDVVAVMGEADQADEYSLFYTSQGPWIGVYLEDGKVTGIMIMGGMD